MSIKILFFGQLADITGTASLVWEDVADTDMLQQQLFASYPELQRRKYLLAVNAKTVQENTPLADNYTIALMPPFSGG